MSKTFHIRINKDDLSKRSGIAEAANRRKAGRMKNRSEKRQSRRSWKKEELDV